MAPTRQHPSPGAALTAFALVWGNLGALAFAAAPLLLVLGGLANGARAAAAACALWAAFVALGPKPQLLRGSGGGRAPAPGWRWFSERGPAFAAMRAYLSLELEVAPAVRAVPAATPLVLALHPHGVLSDNRILLDGLLYGALPGRSVLSLAASVLFALPIVRTVALWTRCIDASRPVARRALAQGHSLLVLPGGEREQFLTTAGREQVYLAKRRGFLRLALLEGARVCPCYNFGSVDLYRTYEGPAPLYALRRWLMRRARVCVPLFTGAWGTFAPRPVRQTIVVGPPVALTDDDDKAAAKAGGGGAKKAKKKAGRADGHTYDKGYSKWEKFDVDAALADVDAGGHGNAGFTDGTKERGGGGKEVSEAALAKAHERYMAALRALFDEHKARLGYGDRELEIV